MRNRGVGIAMADGWNCVCAAALDVSVAEDSALTIHEIACTLHCGIVINPAIVESQIQGGFLYGLNAALWGDIEIRNGQPVLRFDQAPRVRVSIVRSDGPVGGVGEIATSIAAPALTNAIFAAIGRRLRELPVARAGFSLT